MADRRAECPNPAFEVHRVARDQKEPPRRITDADCGLCSASLWVCRGEVKSESVSMPDVNSSDPCYNYTVLDDVWRATNYSSSLSKKCDQSITWVGWYRMMYGGQDVQMPESCVSINMCSTDAPLWINGTHPQLADGVVTRQVCGNWVDDCCHFKSYPIQVKACEENYYVYEFVKPSGCWLTYCAGKPSRYCTHDFANYAAQSSTVALHWVVKFLGCPSPEIHVNKHMSIIIKRIAA
ncbi:hypothetical protein NFI96_010942 [Prochilodus magdalenae]|nr:hypothetical protein NFI96_010942 [Prochilodus magdalenae]